MKVEFPHCSDIGKVARLEDVNNENLLQLSHGRGGKLKGMKESRMLDREVEVKVLYTSR